MKKLIRRMPAVPTLEVTTHAICKRMSAGAIMNTTNATPTVADYMTPGALSISAHEPLLKARAMMEEHGVRQLPVLSDDPSDLGKLVGVISERDLSQLRALADHPSRELVEEAMSRDPYVVSPTTPLNRVARELAERKYGSAVVMEGKTILGMLTTTDALLVLADLLEGKVVRQAYDVGPPQSSAKRPRTGHGAAR